MFKKELKTIIAIMLIGFVVMVAVQGCGKKEHPEHPDSASAEPTKDQLADAVEKYVADKAVEKEGVFIIIDPESGETLELVLDKVHRERLSKVAEGKYFACADFTTKEGKLYDLDVFMEGDDANSLAFSDFSVHKEDGVERYMWYEEDGVWNKKDVTE